MRIGVIGSGFMGAGLGKQFASHGHEVLFSFSHDSTKLRQAADAAGHGATTGSPTEAVQFGDVVLLAASWGAVPEALRAMGSMQGKILISCVNPLTPDYRGLAVGTTTSAAEEIAKLAPGSKLVEAFLNVFAGTLHSESVAFGSDKPAVFYCGDDTVAKSVVGGPIAQIGFEPVDSGALRSARLIEPTAALLLQLGAFRG